MRPVVALVALFCAAAPLSAQTGSAVYKKVAPSTVWFFESGKATGALVDAERKLVVTAEHVVRETVRTGKNEVSVIFAQLDPRGEILVERPFYGFERRKKLAIPGKVIYVDSLRDLALVQLQRLPPGVHALPLAKTPPRPGDDIHVIGNSTFERGGLFSYSSGKVRNSYFFSRPDSGFLFYSVAHHAPTNRGDSGGPVVNDSGELVGIISTGTTGSEGEQVIDQSVHVDEIRKALQPTNLPLVHSIKLTATATLAGAQDRLFLPVRTGNRVLLALRGNGKSDLDLLAADHSNPDPKKRTVVKEVGTSDKESGAFTPAWTGAATVKVLALPLKGTAGGELPRNDYVLAVNCDKAVKGPVALVRYLPSKSADNLSLRFEANKKAPVRMELRGDGDTDLELTVVGPDGAIRRGVGAEDRKQLNFHAESTGNYTIRVFNPHPMQFNSYVLTIN